jgi:hypothetical protein
MGGMMKVLFVDPFLDRHRERILRREKDGGENPLLGIDACGKRAMRFRKTLTLSEACA